MCIRDSYERLCETDLCDFYGKGKKVEFTTDNDYTHVIIVNTAMPVIKNNIPKENVIGLAYEPLHFLNLTQNFVNYAVNNIGKYFIGDKLNLPEPFVEHYGYMWHVTPLRHIPEKKNRMSIMISMKYQTFGHKYRHELTSLILTQGLPVDVYGRGCGLYKIKSSRLKGEFDNLEPYESYDFHIAIENVKSNHYFSEKITNTLLCGTTPIYWGCKNIKDYFGEDVISLTGEANRDVELIKDVLKNPEQYKRNIDVNKIKEKISLLQNLDNIFE